MFILKTRAFLYLLEHMEDIYNFLKNSCLLFLSSVSFLSVSIDWFFLLWVLFS